MSGLSFYYEIGWLIFHCDISDSFTICSNHAQRRKVNEPQQGSKVSSIAIIIGPYKIVQNFQLHAGERRNLRNFQPREPSGRPRSQSTRRWGAKVRLKWAALFTLRLEYNFRHRGKSYRSWDERTVQLRGIRDTIQMPKQMSSRTPKAIETEMPDRWCTLTRASGTREKWPLNPILWPRGGVHNGPDEPRKSTQFYW